MSKKKIKTNSSPNNAQPGLSNFKKGVISNIIRSFDSPVCFEYGCGMSTLHFLKNLNICQWIAVENDGTWLELLKTKITDSRFLIKFCPPSVVCDKEEWWRMENKDPWANSSFFSDYVNAIGEYEPNFVLVDGRARIACVDAAYKNIVDDGVVVMDDAHRVNRSKKIWNATISLWPFSKYLPYQKTLKRESLYLFSKQPINV